MNSRYLTYRCKARDDSAMIWATTGKAQTVNRQTIREEHASHRQPKSKHQNTHEHMRGTRDAEDATTLVPYE